MGTLLDGLILYVGLGPWDCNSLFFIKKKLSCHLFLLQFTSGLCCDQDILNEAKVLIKRWHKRLISAKMRHLSIFPASFFRFCRQQENIAQHLVAILTCNKGENMWFSSSETMHPPRLQMSKTQCLPFSPLKPKSRWKVQETVIRNFKVRYAAPPKDSKLDSLFR